MTNNVIVIGSGPAGLTAAIYAARGGLKPLVFAGNLPGGQLTTTSEIENFPGFPGGINGMELMDKIRAQAERFGAQVIDSAISAVDFHKYPFHITADGKEYTANAVIVATGATTKKLGLASEDALWGRGVSACAVCDGFFFRGKKVVVVGGGDTAMEEATYLTRFASEVTIVHRRDALRASRVLQDRAAADPKIKFAWNSVVEEVLSDAAPRVTGVRVRDVKTGAQQVIECEGLFVAIGHQPNTSIFQGQLALDEHGYIQVHNQTLTSVTGVFVAGDVQDRLYRQAITAAASGAKAALDCGRWLTERNS